MAVAAAAAAAAAAACTVSISPHLTAGKHGIERDTGRKIGARGRGGLTEQVEESE